MDNGELFLYATSVLNARGNVRPEHTLGLVVSYVDFLGVSMCTSFDVPAAGIPVSCEWLFSVRFAHQSICAVVSGLRVR